MAIDLNMDMGAIIKGFVSKHSEGHSLPGMSGKNKFSLAAYKIAIILFVLVVAVSVVYIMVVYLPIKEENDKKKEELAKIVEMKSQLSVLDEQIVKLRKKLDKSKEQYLESLAHFGNSEDLGSLYQTVSTLATKYGMVVLNVKEVTPPPAPPPAVKPKSVAPAPASADGKPATDSDKKDTTAATPPPPPPAPKKPAVDVKEIKVEVELKGHYGEYIKFKEDLALAEILLKINSESIMVKDEKTEQGSIYVKLNLSTYAIDKKPFQGIIAEKADGKTDEKAK